MASKYYKVYQGFQKLFNPSAKKKTDIPTTIIGVKPGKNLTTKRNIQDKVVKAVDKGVKKADVPQSMKESQKTKQYASEMKRKKSKELKSLSSRLDKLREKKMGGGMMGRRMGYSEGSKKGKIPTTPKEKSLAKLAPPKDRITFGDVVAGRTKGKRMQAKDGTGPEQFMRSGKEDPMRDRMKQPLKLKRSKALMLEDLKKSKFKKRKP